MNKFIHAINGLYTNGVLCTDTDYLCIDKKHWDKLDKTGLVLKNLLKVRSDYKDGGIFYGLFIAPKTKYFLTIYLKMVLYTNSKLSKVLPMCLII